MVHRFGYAMQFGVTTLLRWRTACGIRMTSNEAVVEEAGSVTCLACLAKEDPDA